MSHPPFREARIGDHCGDVSTWNPAMQIPNGTFAYIDISAVDQDTKEILPLLPIPACDAPSRARQLVKTGDVIVSTVRPNLNAVALVPEILDGATASTGFCVLRPDPSILESRYLFHWVQGSAFIKTMIRLATGASYPAVSDRIVKDSLIPVPLLTEQRRIAGILDQAEALRAKRRSALSSLDTLAQSIFIEMFGDPVTNPKMWPSVPLREMLRFPLRNGLSPSDAGTVTGRVLTLSAITRGAFDPAALKEAKFHVSPPLDQVVDVEDLLICRGNGNPDLVGRGHFPAQSMADVLFPDTMIAARVDTDRWPKRFVEFAWNATGVRQQIDKLVRTTNGTYKVNQGMLEGVLLLAPPKPLQIKFSRYLDAAAKYRELLRTSTTQLGALFASLQHRAFRGEL